MGGRRGGRLRLALLTPTDNLIEYGTEGWLWAFFGLGQRVALDDRLGRTAAASGAPILAASAYWLREVRDYAFDGLQAAISRSSSSFFS